MGTDAPRPGVGERNRCAAWVTAEQLRRGKLVAREQMYRFAPRLWADKKKGNRCAAQAVEEQMRRSWGRVGGTGMPAPRLGAGR